MPCSRIPPPFNYIKIVQKHSQCKEKEKERRANGHLQDCLILLEMGKEGAFFFVLAKGEVERGKECSLKT